MPGEGTALIAAGCYALSYVLLRKGQSESSLPDHGLFPVLLLGVLTLSSSFTILHYTGVLPVNTHTNWRPILLYSALSGLIGTWLGRMALYAAIEYVGATRGVVIKSMAPLVTLIIAFLLLGERLDDLDTTGTICLLLGVGLVLIDRSWILHRGLLDWFRLGVTLGIASALLQGVGHAMRKLATLHSVNPLVSAIVDLSTALLAYLLWLAFSRRLNRTIRFYASSYNPYVIAAGFLSSAAVLLFFIAVGKAPVSTVSVIIGTEPVLVAVLSGFLLRKLERLTVMTLFASVLVAVGVILTSVDQSSSALQFLDFTNKLRLFH